MVREITPVVDIGPRPDCEEFEVPMEPVTEHKKIPYWITGEFDEEGNIIPHLGMPLPEKMLETSVQKKKRI